MLTQTQYFELLILSALVFYTAALITYFVFNTGRYNTDVMMILASGVYLVVAIVGCACLACL